MIFKKKALFVTFIIMFIIYIVLVIMAFLNLSNHIKANSNSISELTIVLDPGHGGEDGGATANGITEKNINLAISNMLSDIFKSNGFNVVTTRTTDTMVDTYGENQRERKVSDMKNRLELYNKNDSNVVISVHQNMFTQEKYNGTQIFYSANNPKSELLAEAIKKSVVTFIQPDNERETKEATKDIYLLHNATTTSVIVECGFISNTEEAEKLKDTEYQKKLAFSIFTGFMNFYNN